jgi:hypothetical protein
LYGLYDETRTRHPVQTVTVVLRDTFERELRAAVAEGREAFKDFPPVPPVEIPAALVKELVIGEVAQNAVRMCGATITGLLDLADARGASGAACNALILRNCVLTGRNDHPNPTGAGPGIDASHSHLRRLSLIDCQADGVELSNALLDGDLELDGLHAREVGGDGRSCWVKAPGVRIGGSVRARKARLDLPWQRGSDWPPVDASTEDDLWKYWRNTRAPYALDLGEARISGSVNLQPDFVSRAGVRLSGATIGGSFVAEGAELEAAGIGTSIYALFAQYMETQGLVFLREISAGGPLWLFAAKIGGVLDFGGTEVRVRADSEEWALNLYEASVSGDLGLTPRAITSVDLTNTVIGGNLEIAAATAPIELIDARAIRLSGQLSLSGSLSQTDFSGSVFDSQVQLGRPGDSFQLTSVNGSDAKLSLGDARVGSVLRVVGVATRAGVTIDWESGPLRIRTLPLICYRDWWLAEALFKSTCDTGLAILAFLYRPDDNGDEAGLVILNGRSKPIHDLNDVAGTLELATPEQAMQYLLLFCTHVWGDEGAFAIVPGSVAPMVQEGDRTWRTQARVEYGSGLFEAKFKIEPTGEIEMEQDLPLRELPPGRRELYAPPIRWLKVDRFDEWPDTKLALGPESAWSEVSREGEKDNGIWKALARHQPKPPLSVSDNPRSPTGWQKPQIDLGGLKVATLDDNYGFAWFEEQGREEGGDSVSLLPSLQLKLTGFEYDHLSDPSEFKQLWTRSVQKAPLPERLVSLLRRLGSRCLWVLRSLVSVTRTFVPLLTKPRSFREELRWFTLAGDESDQDNAGGDHWLGAAKYRSYWLMAQYETYPPTEDDYRPEPYEQLARVLRASGQFDAANKIAFDRFELEKVRLRPARGTPPMRKALLWAKQHLLWKLLIQWPIGFGLKPLRATTIFVLFWLAGVVAVFALSGVMKIDESAVGSVVDSSGQTERVVVPATQVVHPLSEIPCGDRINKYLYPLDVMIPVIDLRQEPRCRFSNDIGGLNFAKGVYAILGWALTSGLIVTLSGVVRRRLDS